MTLKGVEECRRLVEKLTEEAVEALSIFGDEGESLCWLARSLASRDK